ncbi:MAG: chemotaxis response regulator protein-glutamate methylesterase, partial [Acidobacteria bacterium]|nr:chemotaxis response regulator protein-glutamate methylesterase [Acidobacteriota bacterium]
GLDALRAIRSEFPRIRIIVISSRTARGSADALAALSNGASQCISKNLPCEDGPAGALAALRGKLQPSIKQLGRTARGLASAPASHTVPFGGTGAQAVGHAQPSTAVPQPPRSIAAQAASLSGLHSATSPSTPLAGQGTAAPRNNAAFGTPQVFAIGISTGGPTALHQIIPQLPANFPLPILIVQHMPALFTRLLAERLQTVCALPVHEGADQMKIESGHIYIAPGNFHMRVITQGLEHYIALDQGPQENSCRPAVDVLFRSLSEAYRGSVIAAVLTGMGQDGQLGCETLRSTGAYILAQDEATSVVWGMPGGVARAGLADQILPLQSIIPDVLARCRGLMAAPLRMDYSRARK